MATINSKTASETSKATLKNRNANAQQDSTSFDFDELKQKVKEMTISEFLEFDFPAMNDRNQIGEQQMKFFCVFASFDIF